jgi:AbrB family looped-hinge helix DNA binding protein
MILTVSSKGQISIPASLRHKLGLVAGSKLNLSISGRLLQLDPLYAIQPETLENAQGVVSASTTGKPRYLADFDVASMATL